jgi:hypothetical protein
VASRSALHPGAVLRPAHHLCVAGARNSKLPVPRDEDQLNLATERYQKHAQFTCVVPSTFCQILWMFEDLISSLSTGEAFRSYTTRVCQTNIAASVPLRATWVVRPSACHWLSVSTCQSDPETHQNLTLSALRGKEPGPFSGVWVPILPSNSSPRKSKVSECDSMLHFQFSYPQSPLQKPSRCRNPPKQKASKNVKIEQDVMISVTITVNPR